MRVAAAAWSIESERASLAWRSSWPTVVLIIEEDNRPDYNGGSSSSYASPGSALLCPDCDQAGHPRRYQPCLVRLVHLIAIAVEVFVAGQPIHSRLFWLFFLRFLGHFDRLPFAVHNHRDFRDQIDG